jgi:hypothetical protein
MPLPRSVKKVGGAHCTEGRAMQMFQQDCRSGCAGRRYLTNQTHSRAKAQRKRIKKTHHENTKARKKKKHFSHRHTRTVASYQLSVVSLDNEARGMGLEAGGTDGQ